MKCQSAYPHMSTGLIRLPCGTTKQLLATSNSVILYVSRAMMTWDWGPLKIIYNKCLCLKQCIVMLSTIHTFF